MRFWTGAFTAIGGFAFRHPFVIVLVAAALAIAFAGLMLSGVVALLVEIYRTSAPAYNGIGGQ